MLCNNETYIEGYVTSAIEMQLTKVCEKKLNKAKYKQATTTPKFHIGL
jgi:hypothetical protein